jgi:hypothetical protein
MEIQTCRGWLKKTDREGPDSAPQFARFGFGAAVSCRDGRLTVASIAFHRLAQAGRHRTRRARARDRLGPGADRRCESGDRGGPYREVWVSMARNGFCSIAGCKIDCCSWRWSPSMMGAGKAANRGATLFCSHSCPFSLCSPHQHSRRWVGWLSPSSTLQTAPAWLRDAKDRRRVRCIFGKGAPQDKGDDGKTGLPHTGRSASARHLNSVLFPRGGIGCHRLHRRLWAADGFHAVLNGSARFAS